MTELFPRLCGWCKDPLPASTRRDAKFCSQSCRQASHRFTRIAPEASTSSSPRRLGYADPPYPDNSGYYKGHPDYRGEVDHELLVEGLALTFPDGWALSTSAAALPEVLSFCPRGVRVGAWFRGERPTSSYWPLSGWEPVVVSGGRAYLTPVDERRVDALVHVSRPRTTDPNRVIGSKPAAFCYWMFGLLGALPGDELVDLFPGSGGIERAWQVYESRAMATSDG